MAKKKATQRSPVNQAMADERPEKKRIRDIWVEQVQAFAEYSEMPLYLTLSGALGLDIQRLIDANIVTLNPNGSISAESSRKVVAVERDSTAITELMSRFPGLKIEQGSIQNIFRGESPFRFPDRGGKESVDHE